MKHTFVIYGRDLEIYSPKVTLLLNIINLNRHWAHSSWYENWHFLEIECINQ